MIEPRVSRRAVSATFFQNGLLTGGWALHIPLIMERLSITEGTMGLIIVVFGVGSLAAMLGLGPWIDRHGSREVTFLGAVGSSFFLAALALTGSVWTTALVAFFVGLLIGGVDLAMNANGVVVERRMGRAVMSSFHGWWSVGAGVGALSSGAIIGWVGAFGHGVAFAVIALALAFYAGPRLARDRPDATAEPTPFRLPRAPIVWLIGVAVLMPYVAEGSVIDWSATYLRAEQGAPVSLWGLGVASLSVTMVAMRFAGDALRERVGAFATLFWGGLIASVGFAVAGLAGLPWLADSAFAVRAVLVAGGFLVAGLGLANMVPVAFAAAGNLSGIPSGSALSVATAMGYAGILLAPSALGLLGERTGFATVYLLVAALPLVVMALARTISLARR